MNEVVTFAEFSERFGFNDNRRALLGELFNFLGALRANFKVSRVLAYGSFISDKPAPNDIDVMIHICSNHEDVGFNKYRSGKDLASKGIDVFTLSLESTIGPRKNLLSAEMMMQRFNTLEAHIRQCISCANAFEIADELDTD